MEESTLNNSALKELTYRLVDVVIERPPRVREIAGSIPDPVIQNTLKMVVMATLLCARVVKWLALRLIVVLVIYPKDVVI